MAHYHLIDIPIHFMAGLNDNLIPAKDCFKHYKVTAAAPAFPYLALYLTLATPHPLTLPSNTQRTNAHPTLVYPSLILPGP